MVWNDCNKLTIYGKNYLYRDKKDICIFYILIFEHYSQLQRNIFFRIHSQIIDVS